VDESFIEMLSNGLISVKRVPCSEYLAELIRSTKSIPYCDRIGWMDWMKWNMN